MAKEKHKRILREKFLQIRKSYQPVEELACKASDILFSTSYWRNAKTIALYMPIRNEISTKYIWKQALLEHKVTLFPRCQAEKQMDFACCKNNDDFELASYNILEPKKKLAATKIIPDIILVPALLIDNLGYRLGYGGGYYDRLLAKEEYKNTLSVGFIYSFQFVKKIVRDMHDVPLNAVCTDIAFREIHPSFYKDKK